MLLCFYGSGGDGKGGMAMGIGAGADTISYRAQVLPLLQKKCSPCHFEGGKMYEKMPFDKRHTIISHEAGVLKRFKAEGEISLIKQFIQQESR